MIVASNQNLPLTPFLKKRQVIPRVNSKNYIARSNFLLKISSDT